jgi:PPK2 family polyphosphate:nucleotide phosphotransferase
MFPSARLGDLSNFQVDGDHKAPRIGALDPRDTSGLRGSRAEIEAGFASDIAEIDRLQEILYAESRRALLVILQGLDTSGKDGTIRAVFGATNPAGVDVTRFRSPTEQELAHDFLWRVHRAVPPIGMIGIFNRSHYEDVLVARVHRLAPAVRIEARYRQINEFERHLAENDVTILKFFLHISKKEQKARLRARLADSTKRWKFSHSDLETRKYWDDYWDAYQLVLERCSTESAPWFVVPADHKWFRNAVVARIVRATLEALDPQYPVDIPGLNKVRID